MNTFSKQSWVDLRSDPSWIELNANDPRLLLLMKPHFYSCLSKCVCTLWRRDFLLRFSSFSSGSVTDIVSPVSITSSSNASQSPSKREKQFKANYCHIITHWTISLRKSTLKLMSTFKMFGLTCLKKLPF